MWIPARKDLRVRDLHKIWGRIRSTFEGQSGGKNSLQVFFRSFGESFIRDKRYSPIYCKLHRSAIYLLFLSHVGKYLVAQCVAYSIKSAASTRKLLVIISLYPKIAFVASAAVFSYKTDELSGKR